MKYLNLCLSVIAVVLWQTNTYATGFSNPLNSMEVAQSFVGTHIGTDLDATAETAIFAITDGQVCYYKADAAGYGGGSGSCAVDGEVIFIRHRKADGNYFIAQYGHIQNVPQNYQVTTFTFNGPLVNQGEQIAEVGIYEPHRDCTPGRDDHLHFGIWNSNNQIPMSNWGYGNAYYTNPEGCWVDPMVFLQNESPYVVYTTSWHTQNPNTVVPLYPGQTGSFTVSYTNTGNTDWKNSGGVSNPDYIELRSCNSSGSVVNSWLYYSNWINAQRVVAPNASNVAPGQNAWFVFTGKVPSSATPGTSQNVYFRPYHATGGLINSWGGMHFTVYVVPYYNIQPNLQALNMNSALWQTYYVNMPFADQVTVFVTGEAHTTVSGDDSDLRLKINGQFVSNWNQEKALDGDDLGNDIKSIATTHNFTAGNNTIQIWADRSPTLYNVLVVPYHPWLLCDMVKTIQAPGGTGNYLWFTYHFYVHVSDQYTVTIKGRAAHYGSASDDDDARFVLDGANYGWNNNNALSGDHQNGAERTVNLTRTINSGWRTLAVNADQRPKITAIYVERGNGGAILCSQPEEGNQEIILIEPPENNALIPKLPTLAAFPNPTNLSATVQFELAEEGRAELTVYNLRGQLVRTLYSDIARAGPIKITWDGATEKGIPLPAGIYFLRLAAARQAVSQKLVLLK